MAETVTTLREWRAWRRDGFHTLPLLRRVSLGPGGDRPMDWNGAWAAAYPHAIILESGKAGRYTYLGLRPSAVLRGKGNEAEVLETGGAAAGLTDVAGVAAGGVESALKKTMNGAGADGEMGASRRRLTGKPLDVLRSWIAACKGPPLPDGPKWTGGIAGFLGYDIARSIERLPETASDDLGLPDYLFLRLDELWIIDHERRELILARHTWVPDGTDDAGLGFLYKEALRHTDNMRVIWDGIAEAAGSPEARAEHEGMRELLAREQANFDPETFGEVRLAMTKEAFMEAVRRIRRYIAQGDVFQVNLSLRQSRRLGVSAETLYEWLRLINPSPYMGFLRTPDFRLVSASPELLVRLERGRLATRPIAGTRPRGASPDEDARLEAELLDNSKERAEHLMLVDLARNDLGRVSRFGTVRVPEFMTVERYSHVMHLVSQVEGELAPGKDAFDALAAVFPGGTITGAPKIRTMEIIEELEPVRRGPYTGSLGWIDYSGNMEFNIIIRTVTVRDGVAHIQTGAGIVIDSDPLREYRECLHKAEALWKAVRCAETAAGAAGKV